MNSLFSFLLVIQGFVAAGLVTLVLMQRSEGGGLGIGGGGSPGGMLSARGAADFLSRATKWFAVIFVVLAIVLAAVAVDASGANEFEETLDRSEDSADEDADLLLPSDDGVVDGESEASESEAGESESETDSEDEALSDLAG